MIRKCLTLAVALAVVATATAANNKNNKPSAGKNNKPSVVKPEVVCADVSQKRLCKKAKPCLWAKSECIDTSEVTCDMATSKVVCGQIGCWFDKKEKNCVEKFEATCAMAYNNKDCRTIDAGCYFDKAEKVCVPKEQKPVFVVDDPTNDCQLKTKKKQCKVFQNCAWRGKTKACIVNPKLVIPDDETDGETDETDEEPL